jgi:excisionase family DNA binding protein
MQPVARIFYDTQRAAAFLGTSESTLEKWRVRGGDPAYRKHGRRVLYKVTDLETWSDA